MEQKEKQILVTTFSTILIFAVYSIYVYQNYIKPDPAIIHDFKFWGKAFLILIPIAIVAQIIIHIFFAIINKAVTNEDFVEISDERDKLIELKSLRVSHWIFTLGFLVAMGSQAIGMEPWIMFLTLISFGFLSGIISEVVKFWYYRKGF